MTNLQCIKSQLEQLQQVFQRKIQLEFEQSKPKNSYDVLIPIRGTDEFLNYIEYSPQNLSIDKANSYFKSRYPQTLGQFACTQVLSKRKMFRNFDYIYDNNAQFIVKMNRDNDKVKYSSIGMTLTDSNLSKQRAKISAYYSAYNPFFDALPYLVADGMNEAGVYAGMNAVEKNDVKSIDIGSSSKDECCTMMLVRWILDNVDNADDIEHYLSQLHIYGTSYLDMNIHLTVANKYRAYAVEFEEDHFEVNMYPILSNFRTNRGFELKRRYLRDYHADWATVESNGHGLERWDICADFLRSKSTDFDELRAQLKFSRSYTDIDESQKDTWLTDLPEVDGVVYDVNCAEDCHQKKERSAYYDDFMELMKQRNQKFLRRKREDEDTQHTVHSCLYDFESKQLQLWIQERDDMKWTVSLT